MVGSWGILILLCLLVYMFEIFHSKKHVECYIFFDNFLINIIYLLLCLSFFNSVFVFHVILFKMMVVFVQYHEVYTHTYFEMTSQYQFLVL